MEKNKVKKKEIGEQKVLGDESEGSIGSNSRIFGKTPRERDILGHYQSQTFPPRNNWYVTTNSHNIWHPLVMPNSIG